MTEKDELIKAHSGPTLEDWLIEEGFYAESSAVAFKRVEEWQARHKKHNLHKPRHLVLVRYGRPVTDKFYRAS